MKSISEPFTTEEVASILGDKRSTAPAPFDQDKTAGKPPADGEAGKAAAPAEQAKQGEPPPPAPAEPPASAPSPSIAELIAENRRAKETHKAREGEATTLREKLDQAQAALSKYEKAREQILADPITYIKSLGVETTEDIRIVGEQIMYALFPNEAPKDLKTRAMQAQLRRDMKAQEERYRAEREEEVRIRADADVTAYRNTLRKFANETEEFPLSAAWYEDADEYADALFQAAVQLASNGRDATDPKVVARTVEDFLSGRKAKWNPPKTEAPSEPKETPAAAKDTKQESKTKTSDNKKVTEEERMTQAIEQLGGFFR